MTTLLFEDAIFARHEVPAGHVERPERVLAIAERFQEGAFVALPRGTFDPAGDELILAVHQPAYLERIRNAVPAEGLVALDLDTFLGAAGLEAAFRASGAVAAAVDAVMTGAADNAFCAVRPPGHHATPNRAMGFCVFNHAAIGARRAQRRHGAERVAIVDWDVHHGNGTQDAFWDDPTVLYCSTHQMPLYPYTGAASETGAGNIVNVPLADGAGPAEFAAALEERILPAVDRFAPDLIIISAGFDAHERDPLGGLRLRANDFADATRWIREAAENHCGGRIVSTLEGGYDIQGLVDSTAAHVAAMME